MSDNYNRPAFPQPLTDNQGRVDYPEQYGVGGLTKLEYFTAMAMQGLIIQDPADIPAGIEMHDVAIAIAKATLDALEKEGK
jgi:hypothetical protein